LEIATQNLFRELRELPFQTTSYSKSTRLSSLRQQSEITAKSEQTKNYSSSMMSPPALASFSLTVRASTTQC